MIAIISALILITFYTRDESANYFYYLTFYFIVSAFTSIYYLKFIVEYPSLIQPKWKAWMPFNLPKVAAATTLAFLAVSLYYTARESPNFIIVQNIPHIFGIAFLLPVFLAVLLIFTYLKTLSARTKLRYWGYQKYGQYIHLAVTSYVFGLIFLSWNNATNSTKISFALFGLVAFAFYLSFALDLHTILKDQNIKPIFDKLDVLLSIVFFCSSFFLILFGISLSYGWSSGFIGIELISYPLILLFIAFFLIVFGSYLSVTHKGFEEVLRKNIWSELSYLFAFIVFILVYFIYTSLNTNLQQFPYHNFAFIGYLAVLIIEILSTKTLAEQFEDRTTRKSDISRLLNFYTSNFLRADYLEDLWEKILSEYVDDEAGSNVIFDSSRREFNLEEADEITRLTVAVRILLEMHKIPDGEKIMIQRRTLDEAKDDIVHTLEEKILLLPEDLRAEFDERTYYPTLFEKTINELLSNLKTFIPLSEQKKIFEKLKRREELFKNFDFEVDEIRLKEGMRFSRDEFLKLLKLYLEVIEEKFPFKRCLLRGIVKEEIAKDLQTTISAGDVFDIVPMGSKEIDMAIAGGLVKGTATVLITEETKAKQKILVSFIKKGLKEGIVVIYATSKRPFEQVVGELRMEAAELKKFMLLDFYEHLYTENRVPELVEDELRIIVPLSKILFQRSIVKAIKSQPKDVPKIVILDVYDDFSRYYSPDEIFELLQNQMEGLKRWNCTSLIVLDPYSYLIKKEGINEVKRHFDNVMILSGEDKDAQMFIEKLYHGTPSKPLIHLPW